MKALFLTLLLCFSCTKYAEVSKDVGVEISPVQMEISHLNEIEWNVGQRKAEAISQSFSFIVDLPKIKEEDVDFLVKQKNIDAWILRLIVTRGSESQDLGSLFTLLRPQRLGRGSSGDSPKSVTLKVFYAAAFASERFRAFKCPAFGHNKKIKEMSIEGGNDEFTLQLGPSVPYNEKSHQVELTPSPFNGSNSIVGNYYVEIAAYDSKRKIIHSAFKRIPMFISVKSEESINVPSCEGVHPEVQ
jgi:hypothetical protein